MEDLFEQLKRAVAPAQDSAAKRTATAMDGISDRMADAAAASYMKAIAEDSDFDESKVKRTAKGGKGGGQFAKKPETLAKEDERDNLDPDAPPQMTKEDVTDKIGEFVGEKLWGFEKAPKKYGDAIQFSMHDGYHIMGKEGLSMALGFKIKNCGEFVDSLKG